ncbi:hypothetical protein [Leucobacter coleopterorum]|uniref:hypothetical protein n=1 Tax=Leucobacter coleopterorum TaxID=2714933 RepID=UPI001FCBBF6F|nr:hypothetical protein [Leucobacter coleopterorum]
MNEQHSVPGTRTARVPSSPRFLRSCVTRPRLLDVLDAGFEYQVTLLRAPSGYGKTQLVADWLEKRLPAHPETHALWVDVVDSHRSASHVRHLLWRELVEIIRADPTLAEQESSPFTSTLLDAASFTAYTPSRQRAALLELLDLSVEKTLLVVFDCDELGLDGESFADCEWLLQKARNLRVWVAGPFEAFSINATFELSIDCHVIPSEVLLFTASETSEAARLLSVRLNQAEAEHLRSITNGLPRLVREVILRATSHADTSKTESTTTRFRRAVQQSVQRSMQDMSAHSSLDLNALAALSYPPFLTEQLANAIQSDPHASDALTALQRTGYGGWESVGDRQQFIMLETVRSYLQEHHSLDPELVAQIRRQSANEMERIGYPIEACQEYLLLEDEAGVERVLQQHFPWGLWVKRYELSDIMRAVPREMLLRRPLFLGIRAASTYWAYGIDKREFTELRTVVDTIDASGAVFDAREELLFIAAKIFLLTTRDPEAHIDEVKHQLLLHAQDGTTLKSPLLDLIFGVALNHLASLHIQLGRYTESETLLDLLIGTKLPDRAVAMRLRAQGHKAVSLVLRGDVKQSRELLNECHTSDYWSLISGTYWARFFRLAEAYIAIEDFDHRLALEIVAELREDSNTYEDGLLVVHAHVMALLLGGFTNEAMETLRDALDVVNASEMNWGAYQVDLLRALQIDLLLASEHFATARSHLETGRSNTSPYFRALNRFALRTGDAIQVLARAKTVLNEPNRTIRERAEHLILQAVAAHELNNDALAADSWRRALELNRRFGITTPLLQIATVDMVITNGETLQIFGETPLPYSARLESFKGWRFSRSRSSPSVKVWCSSATPRVPPLPKLRVPSVCPQTL